VFIFERYGKESVKYLSQFSVVIVLERHQEGCRRKCVPAGTKYHHQETVPTSAANNPTVVCDENLQVKKHLFVLNIHYRHLNVL